ncbi:MAG: PEP-CTERM sorting domain-containing protein [Phycisphaerae bacterium]|nr:PEP-CTERM sorting domain-containing protein [Phycisphaerales bacterium]
MFHPITRYRYIVAFSGALVACAVATVAHAGPTDQPQPIGSSTMSITYNTSAGDVTYFGSRTHNGTGPGDVTNLGGAPNVGAFSAHNALGRRPATAQGSNETLMRHGFYKFGSSGFNIAGDFFPDIAPGSDVTIAIENVQFDRPVQVQEDTALLHILWDLDQVDSLGLNDQNLPRSYVNPNNHHTVTNFRDVAEFQSQNVFLENPVPNYNLGDIVPVFSQPQPDTVSVSLTFPYELLHHFEDDGLGVPAGLPGPGGFLEPFHLHLEYLVVPEPSAGLLLAMGAMIIRRRR